MATFISLPKVLLLKLIRFYQLCLSPYWGYECRFYPSCSNYAKDAIQKHGFAQGSWLMISRLLKCHPFHPGGVDEIP